MKAISIKTDDNNLIINFEANESKIFQPTLSFKNENCTLPLLLTKNDIFNLISNFDQSIYIKNLDFDSIKTKCIGFFKLMGAIEAT